MAVLENAESKMASSDLNNSVQTTQRSKDHQISESDSKLVNGNGHVKSDGGDEVVVNGGFDYSRENGSSGNVNGNVESLKRGVKELDELLSNLNPMAEEFVPHSVVKGFNYGVAAGALGGGFGYGGGFVLQPPGSGDVNGHMARQRSDGLQKKNAYNQGKRRMNSRTNMAQKEDVIRRTVYVSDIDQHITEEQLAGLFLNCGQVVDCRVCGDPNSVLRFAFLEFTNEESARVALTLSGTMLGFHPVKVMPSKTAIAPVNPTFLPRSEEEREMCIRTIYCTNIDRKITTAEVKFFFEKFCGEVNRLRLLGDYRHNTRISFVEFVKAESAIAALNCSGSVLGILPIRVSPSKTPVRPRAPRPSAH